MIVVITCIIYHVAIIVLNIKYLAFIINVYSQIESFARHLRKVIISYAHNNRTQRGNIGYGVYSDGSENSRRSS